jgi:gas vesicle protein
VVKKRTTKAAISTLIGVGIGYAAGVLTAPKSGKETRKSIQKSAIGVKKDAEKGLKNAHSELSKLIATSKKKSEKLGAKTKKELIGAINKAQKAKDKSREILSAVHEGEAEDADLQKALEEAKKSLANLKKYIIKNSGSKTK